jgi:rhodanese-related sulfurtransferase
VGFNIGAKGGLNPLAAQTQSSPFVPCGINDAPVADPPMIHVAEMKKLLEDKSATFVDVRGSGAFKEAHIPTAVNATIDQLQKKIPPELSKSKLIVFYEAGGADDSCTTSKTAGRILMQNGFKEVKVFKEGLEGWKKEGLPIAQ